MEPVAKRARTGSSPMAHDGAEDDDFNTDDELALTSAEFEARQDPAGDYQFGKKQKKSISKLKAKFEDIFARYNQDFEGECDEVDFYTGELTIDNGHLQGLADDDAALEEIRETTRIMRREARRLKKELGGVASSSGAPKRKYVKKKKSTANESSSAKTQQSLNDNPTAVQEAPKSLANVNAPMSSLAPASDSVTHQSSTGDTGGSGASNSALSSIDSVSQSAAARSNKSSGHKTNAGRYVKSYESSRVTKQRQTKRVGGRDHSKRTKKQSTTGGRSAAKQGRERPRKTPKPLGISDGTIQRHPSNVLRPGLVMDMSGSDQFTTISFSAASAGLAKTYFPTFIEDSSESQSRVPSRTRKQTEVMGQVPGSKPPKRKATKRAIKESATSDKENDPNSILDMIGAKASPRGSLADGLGAIENDRVRPTLLGAEGGAAMGNSTVDLPRDTAERNSLAFQRANEPPAPLYKRNQLDASYYFSDEDDDDFWTRKAHPAAARSSAVSEKPTPDPDGIVDIAKAALQGIQKPGDPMAPIPSTILDSAQSTPPESTKPDEPEISESRQQPPTPARVSPPRGTRSPNPEAERIPEPRSSIPDSLESATQLSSPSPIPSPSPDSAPRASIPDSLDSETDKLSPVASRSPKDARGASKSPSRRGSPALQIVAQASERRQSTSGSGSPKAPQTPTKRHSKSVPTPRPAVAAAAAAAARRLPRRSRLSSLVADNSDDEDDLASVTSPQASSRQGSPALNARALSPRNRRGSRAASLLAPGSRSGSPAPSRQGTPSLRSASSEPRVVVLRRMPRTSGSMVSSPLARGSLSAGLGGARQPETPRHPKIQLEVGIVRTPGGTLRRCGEAGLVCDRDFCFTCCK